MDTTGAFPPRALAWLTEWVAEDDVAKHGRVRAAEAGIACVDDLTTATLRWLAASTSAKAIVEVGTGAGVSTLALARGMAEGGVLTSIDAESGHQQLAKETLADAGFGGSGIRLISGRGLEVMPRLTDGAYDLVVLDAAPTETGAYVEQAGRLLRPGGILAVIDALASGFRVTEPASREPDVVALRAAMRAMADDERWVATVLPLSNGMLTATRK